MKEQNQAERQGKPSSQLLTYAAIGITCIVIGFFLAGGFGPQQAGAPVANTILTPAPSPVAPSPSPSPSPAPSVAAAQPSAKATPAAATLGINDMGPAVEAAANKALAARNSSKKIKLDRLTYNVGPLTNPSRTYYQGEVVTLFQNGTTFVAVNLKITVYDLFKGEVNIHPVSASSVLDIDGRKVSISGSDADFEASMPCLSGSIYVYAKETGRTFSPRELYEQIAASCPE